MSGPARPTRLEAIGCRVFGVLLRCAPGWFRDRAGQGMLQVFAARQREALESGRMSALPAVWLHEAAGVLLVSFRAWREGPGDLARERSLSRRRPTSRREKADDMELGGARRRGVGPFVSDVVADLRFALRSAARRPAPHALALITCALGIGASTAMFGIVYSVLWQPLPYPEQDRLVTVYPTIPSWIGDPVLGEFWNRGSWSYPEFVDWRPRQTVFESAAIYGSSVATLAGDGEPLRLVVGEATPEFFDLLGARPQIGRAFDANDGPADPVVLLTHSFWQSRYGGSADVVGSVVELDGTLRTVVGVLPPDFEFSAIAAPLWAPVGGAPDEAQRANHNHRMIARLADGVSIEAAQAQTESMLLGLSGLHDGEHGAFVVPRLEDETRQARTPLIVLLAGSILLLVVACVNVATLLLGIGIDRRPEFVVRGAIGAGRRRLIRQLVTESTVLGLAGGAAGILLAIVCARLMLRLAPPGVPRLDAAGVQPFVVALAASVSLAVGIAFGLAPALSITRDDTASRLREVRSTAGRHRLHGTLVIAQIAIAAVLVFGAGLLARTLGKLDAVDPGFDPAGVLTVRVAPPFREYVTDREFDRTGYDAYFERLREAAAAVPGVSQVALTSTLPFSSDRANNEIEPEGYSAAAGEKIYAERNVVSANYMEVIGMRIVQGRSFTPADDRADAAPVMIVTENFARRFWPDGSAVGRIVTYFAGTFTVVGIAADVRDRSLDSGDEVRFYVPRGRIGGSGGSFVIRARPGVDPASLAPALRQSMWSVDPDLPITSTALMSDRIADSLAEQRFRARLMSAFGGLATLFALLGVYGVTSRAVASRRRELGIRAALGSTRSGIAGLVVRHALVTALPGTIIGLATGIAGARVLASLLYETGGTDTVVLLGTGCAFIALAILASFVPSMRAASVEPMAALRPE